MEAARDRLDLEWFGWYEISGGGYLLHVANEILVAATCSIGSVEVTC